MSGDFDQENIKRVAGGDSSALRALYERHADALEAFVRVRLRDPFEAADVVHETFLDVWRTAGRYEGRAAVRSWIFSIARNKTIDRVRKASRAAPLEPDHDVADEAPDPAAVLAASQEAAIVRACLDALSDSQRAAVRLAFYEDLTYTEIAEIEGCAVGTVKSRIHHAKQLLMRCLTLKKRGGQHAT